MGKTSTLDKLAALTEALDQYNETADAAAYELSLDLADIIIKKLDEMQRSQKWLAERVGMSEAHLSRIIHASDTNPTFETTGRLLHALQVRATLKARPYPDEQPRLSQGKLRLQNARYTCTTSFSDTASTAGGDRIAKEA